MYHDTTNPNYLIDIEEHSRPFPMHTMRFNFPARYMKTYCRLWHSGECKSCKFSGKLLNKYRTKSYKLCPHIPCLRVNCYLTNWGLVTHVCVGKLTNIGLDNSLSPGRRQAIIWNNVGILSMRPLETNFSEILITIHTFLSGQLVEFVGCKS